MKEDRINKVLLEGLIAVDKQVSECDETMEGGNGHNVTSCILKG